MSDKLMPTCDRGDHRLAEFVWFGQFLCRQHAWKAHARGHFRECPWHGRYCPAWRGQHVSMHFDAKRKAAAAGLAASLQLRLD